MRIEGRPVAQLGRPIAALDAPGDLLRGAPLARSRVRCGAPGHRRADLQHDQRGLGWKRRAQHQHPFEDRQRAVGGTVQERRQRGGERAEVVVAIVVEVGLVLHARPFERRGHPKIVDVQDHRRAARGPDRAGQRDREVGLAAAVGPIDGDQRARRLRSRRSHAWGRIRHRAPAAGRAPQPRARWRRSACRAGPPAADRSTPAPAPGGSRSPDGRRA